MKKKSETKDDVPIGGYFDYSKWYCPNCAKLNIGFPDDKGAYKSICPNCGIVMRRKRLSRTKDTIELAISNSF